MATPSAAATLSMLRACTEHMELLEARGVDPDVARDRCWDAYEAAWLGLDRHCFDPRDRLFESRLRTIAAKSTYG